MTFQYIVSPASVESLSPETAAPPRPRRRRRRRFVQAGEATVIVRLPFTVDRRKDLGHKFSALARHYPLLFDDPSVSVEAISIDGAVFSDPLGYLARTMFRVVDADGYHRKAL